MKGIVGQVNLTFYDAKVLRPSCSCSVITVGKHGIVQELDYSRRHDAFNAMDSDASPEHSYEPTAWAYAEDIKSLIASEASNHDEV